jgi:aspartyl-tRNA(Asn)/glutamyl-tRNA(Gln) amidotransferase subunit B
MNYEPVIGLEVHVQLRTESKMFCRSRNAESDKPNVNICEVCTGHPGTLPVINREAVKKALMVGAALNCKISEFSKFDRKNYFYPDLPKGYQISQFDHPINGPGHFEISVDGEKRTVRILRAHLEEDAGKLIHPQGANYSLVDYNRAGVPLLEIVSEPDIKSPKEAKIYLQELQNLMRYLGVSDADMEKGHLRCDANISLKKKGDNGLPAYKVEVKNMNSFRAVERALAYEAERQALVLDQGKLPEKETRGWVEEKGITVSQRSKEESEDYRYFPEPDLPVLEFSKEWLEEIRRTLPELPAARKIRFFQEYALKESDAHTLVGNKELADYFEKAVSELYAWIDAEQDEKLKSSRPSLVKTAGNWVIGQFSALLNEHKQKPLESKVTPENFAELVKLIYQGKASQLSAKDVFERMFETGEDPSDILDELGLVQVSDVEPISEAVKKVLAENPKAVADVSSKGERAFGFLVGQVMKELKGKGNPKVINEILKKELGM